MNDNKENWINTVGAAIKSIQPGALTTASLFAANLVEGSGRRPFKLAEVARSTVNYLDTHNYTQTPSGVALELQSLGISSLASKKPIVMGEFGAESRPTRAASAEVQSSHFKASCAYGYSGWLWWTLDTGLYGSEDTMWRGLMQDDGAMNGNFASVSPTKLSCVVSLPAAYEHVACFNETAYLRENPDVLDAVETGAMASGYQHFLLYGKQEGRSGCSN